MERRAAGQRAEAILEARGRTVGRNIIWPCFFGIQLQRGLRVRVWWPPLDLAVACRCLR